MFCFIIVSFPEEKELVSDLTELPHGCVDEGVASLSLAPALRLLTAPDFPPPNVQTDGVVRHLPVLRVVHWHRVEILSPDQLACDVLAHWSLVDVDRGEQIVNHPVKPAVLRKEKYQKLIVQICCTDFNCFVFLVQNKFNHYQICLYGFFHELNNVMLSGREVNKI